MDATKGATGRYDHPLCVELTPEERSIMRHGLGEWLGPACATDEFAVAMGFSDVADLVGISDQLGEAIWHGVALSPTDWVRALLATEVSFVSDVVGSGSDWAITTGLSDQRTLELLRSIQLKIQRAVPVREVLGTSVGTIPPW